MKLSKLRVVLNHVPFLSKNTFSFFFVSSPPSKHVVSPMEMDREDVTPELGMVYPIVFLPKRSTNLETNANISDNVYINMNMTTIDAEGNEMCIYSGFCCVKMVDSCDTNIPTEPTPETSVSLDDDIENMPIILSEANQLSFPAFNQSRVWIDPSRSPYVYNNYDVSAQEHFSIHETQGCITVEQHNTYITQNVYNYKETNICNVQELPKDFGQIGQKKYRKIEATAGQSDPNKSYYEDDEFECGIFLSNLPEEIINEKKSKDKKPNISTVPKIEDKSALRQLLSQDIEPVSKQRKTILYLGEDSYSGQTIQNISYNDPMMTCAGVDQDSLGDVQVDHEVVIDSTVDPKKKRYQCDKCKQIFNDIASFRQHMVGNHNLNNQPQTNNMPYKCNDCGRLFKNAIKYETHCLGHGDPELECDKCHKVFASKFTLRAHQKLHNRKHLCDICAKSFVTGEGLRQHAARSHSLFMCDTKKCNFVAGVYSDLCDHQRVHREISDDDIDSNLEVDMKCEELDTKTEPVTESDKITEPVTEGDKIRQADIVIAKVMSNKVFLLNSKKANKQKCHKRCEVCRKTFDRIGDLKRHLIEHVIKSTMAKTPINEDGTLDIQCEVCRTQYFTKVDKYKAHLREHAKLTLYKCTFCDKSFSDSSNFSKHKKIHGTAYFQCDLCHRKFNSKKMIAQHMEYHTKNKPIKCKYCTRIFHFQSMLNKHVKNSHHETPVSKFRCTFCDDIFKSLRDKWDHEWDVHNVRKLVVDCLICGSKFRKYSQLKRHCIDEHNLDIPPARKLLTKRYNNYSS